MLFLSTPVKNSPYRAPDEVPPKSLVTVHKYWGPLLPANIERSDTLKRGTINIYLIMTLQLGQ